MTVNLDVKNFDFSSKMKKVSIGLILIGLGATIAAFSINKTIAWVDFLVNNLYFITLAVSGIFFVSVQGLMQASWVSPFRRIIEAYSAYLPVAIVLMIPVCFGLHSLYEWTHMDIVMNDPILSQKTAWLNEKFFIGRMFLYLVLWAGIACSQRRMSKKQDETNEDMTFKFTRNSVIHLTIFGFTICFAAFDWIMSVEPHWFSTIFGIYIFAGSFVSGICFIILAMIKLSDWGYLNKYMTPDLYHDLGKWLFGMSTFWAYIWISQYLLIWYANIPEETEYFVLRQDHWSLFFGASLVLNWVVPFFGLMTRSAKRNPKVLKIVASIVLFGHFIDLYLMVAPKIYEHAHTHAVGFGALQLLQWCGFAGIFLYVFGSTLSKSKLFNTGDPNLEEGLHLHQ